MDELSDDVIAFLSEGTRTAVLGWVAADGRPLAAPVWFVVDDGALVFNTGKDTAKGRALARDPRVVLCVDDSNPPYGFVRDPGRGVDQRGSRRASRHRHPHRRPLYGRRPRRGIRPAQRGAGELVVRVKPTKVHAAFDVAD